MLLELQELRSVGACFENIVGLFVVINCFVVVNCTLLVIDCFRYRSESCCVYGRYQASLALLDQKSVAHRAFMLPKFSAVITPVGLEKDCCIA